MAELKPFADDAAVLTVGGLTVENGRDRVTVHGSLDIARDRQGLAAARALRDALAAVVQVLEADAALPDHAAPHPPAATRTRNPFA